VSTFLAVCVGTILVLLLVGQRPARPDLLMSVIGSGGHTHEMWTLVRSIIEYRHRQEDDDQKREIGGGVANPFNEILFVVSAGDQLSRDRLAEAFPELDDGSR